MGTTLETIAGFMDARGVKYQLEREKSRILTGFGTKNYKDASGHSGVLLSVEVKEDGEYLIVTAPEVYKYKDGPHLTAVLQACLWVCFATKSLQYEYDYRDGEIRAVVEIPLEDAILTEKQLFRILLTIPTVLDRYDSVVRSAIERGTPPSEATESGRDPATLAGLLGQLPPDLLAAALAEVQKRRGRGDSDEGGGSGPSTL